VSSTCSTRFVFILLFSFQFLFSSRLHCSLGAQPADQRAIVRRSHGRQGTLVDAVAALQANQFGFAKVILDVQVADAAITPLKNHLDLQSAAILGWQALQRH
jgi:hypothetical protein